MEPDVYLRIKTSTRKLLNIDLDQYKDAQMQRRLEAWLNRKQLATWEEYFHLIRQDANELEKFRAYLMINVSSFFRDRHRWQELEQTILPRLRQNACSSANSNGSLHIWSAGCSIGAEIYSLAILLNQWTPGLSHYLLATDIDRAALDQARTGGPYSASEVQNVTPAQIQAFFQPGGPPYYVNRTLIRQVNFRENNLLSDVFGSSFDLIVCRNVVIYFTDQAKGMLYQKFSQALRPGGILFLGGTEIIPRPTEYGLSGIKMSFYEKL